MRTLVTRAASYDGAGSSGAYPEHTKSVDDAQTRRAGRVMASRAAKRIFSDMPPSSRSLIRRSVPGLLTLGIALSCVVPASAGAQSQPSAPLAPAITASGRRPVPGPVYEIPGFTRAVDAGTRTRSGRPGARYWVQHAR